MKDKPRSADMLPPVDPERLLRTGLTPDEVALRRVHGLTHASAAPAGSSVIRILRRNLLTYYNMIFLLLATLLVLVRSFRDLTFLGVVAANAVLGIVQEVRAQNTLDRLRLITQPRAEVLRDSASVTIPPEELVQDDLVVLRAGVQIPADAQVLEGTLQVNEALLTGEADEIEKVSGDALLSGSFVVSGSCRARLTRVGQHSYAAALTRQATAARRGEQSEMIRDLNRLVIVVGIVIVPVGVLLFGQQYAAGTSVRESLIAMVAAILGMIPEGLYLLATVAMTVSTVRLAANRVLVHDMKCIEALARVDVLCVDKTGTITQPEMTVARVEPAPGTDPVWLHGVCCALVQHMPDDNATMAALKGYFTSPAPAPDKIQSFSARYKYSGMELGGCTYLLGAPEFLLGAASDTPSDVLQRYTAQGFRVLAVGRSSSPLPGAHPPPTTELLGWVLLINPIRAEARPTFAGLAAQQVALRVISGDHAETVSAVARQAGIPGAERYVDVSGMDEQALAEAAGQYIVFGRVTPEQKCTLIRALKARGHTVGMTGDGVNDVLALREADCSIAMASGSEAAARIAQLVLLDSDFSRLPAIAAEGRRVVNNIQRSAVLFLVKNIFSLLLALFSLATCLAYPLKPAQISLISLFSIGLPSFLLALEPNDAPLQGRFLSRVLGRALPGGLTNMLCAGVLMVMGQGLHLTDGQSSTICALVIAFVGLLVLQRTASPLNLRRRLLLTAMILGLIGCALGLNKLFALEPLPLHCTLLTAVICIAAIPVYRWSGAAVRRVWKYGLRRLRR